MENFLIFLIFIIFSFWVLIFSYIFYQALLFDRSIKPIIETKKQLRKYQAFIVFMLTFSSYIFMVRINRIGLTINIWEVKSFLENWIASNPWWIIFLVIVLVLEWLLLGFFYTQWLYLQLSRLLATLYIYYYQYTFFREKLCYPITGFVSSFTSYLANRVLLFSKNRYLLYAAYWLWPNLFYRISSVLFRFLLPYLCIYDYMTQNGIISHIFEIMPWFYICFLVKSGWSSYVRCATMENHKFSDRIYRNFMETAPKNWSELFYSRVEKIQKLWAYVKNLFTPLENVILALVYIILFLIILGGGFYVLIKPYTLEVYWQVLQAYVYLELFKTALLLINMLSLLRILEIIKYSKFYLILRNFIYAAIEYGYKLILIFITKIGFKYFGILDLAYDLPRKSMFWLLKNFSSKVIFISLLSINVLPRIIFSLSLGYDVLFGKTLYYTFFGMSIFLISYLEQFFLFILKDFYDVYWEYKINSIRKKPGLRNTGNVMDANHYEFHPAFATDVKDMHIYFESHLELLSHVKLFLDCYKQWKYEKLGFKRYEILLLIIRVWSINQMLIGK